MQKYVKDLLPKDIAIEESPDGFIITGTSRSSVTDKKTVNIIGLGDVGRTTLLGLKLMGSDCVGKIGIYDTDENAVSRCMIEMNQISMPGNYQAFPEVVSVGRDDLFKADIVVFAATKEVPAVKDTDETDDVRMAQLEANSPIIEDYAKQAADENFAGYFCVVSDPVDPLCKIAQLQGMDPYTIMGFGLGVMNARCAYYAKQDESLVQYLASGRVYGTHGNHLIVCDSMNNFSLKASEKLKELVLGSNLETRKLGYKPYIAPAVSSAAISILEMIRGNWNYSSLYFGNEFHGTYFGCKNRITTNGAEVEDYKLNREVFWQCETSYRTLLQLVY